MVETLVFRLEMLSLELNRKHFKSFPENPSALVMTWLTGLPKINNYGFQSGMSSKEGEEKLQVAYLLFYFYICNYSLLGVGNCFKGNTVDNEGSWHGVVRTEEGNRKGVQCQPLHNSNQQIRRRLFKKMPLNIGTFLK